MPLPSFPPSDVWLVFPQNGMGGEEKAFYVTSALIWEKGDGLKVQIRVARCTGFTAILANKGQKCVNEARLYKVIGVFLWVACFSLLTLGNSASDISFNLIALTI